MKRPSNIRDLFVYFVEAREEARLNKELGFFPHHDDPVLQEYKFCNINREHDRVTAWVKEHVRDVVGGDYTMLLQNLAVARVFNEPDLLKHIVPVDSMYRLHMRIIRLQEEKIVKRVFRGAYMMPVHGANGKGRSAIEYWCENVASLKHCEMPDDNCLESAAKQLKTMPAFGPFLINQICADLRYTQWFPHFDTPDWETYVEFGPGTTRGIQRFFELHPFGPKKASKVKMKKETIHYIRALLAPSCSQEINSYFQDPNNLCNAFCEFDKFCRAALIPKNDNRHRIGLRKYLPTIED